ncbi:hypothetical protein U1Q18_018833, partial [Sarracenia purpurea var. burkii]
KHVEIDIDRRKGSVPGEEDERRSEARELGKRHSERGCKRRKRGSGKGNTALTPLGSVM